MSNGSYRIENQERDRFYILKFPIFVIFLLSCMMSFPAKAIPATSGLIEALNTIRAEGAPDGLADVLAAFDALPAAEQPNALLQLLPADLQGISIYSAMKIQNLMLDKISKRLDRCRYMGYGANTSVGLDEYITMMGNPSTYGPIIFGSVAKQESHMDVPGYNFGTAGGGLLFDVPLDCFGRIGVGVTYAQTVSDTKSPLNVRLEAGSFQMLGYGMLQYRWVFIDGVGYYGLNNYRSRRNITFIDDIASAKYSGLQWGGRGRIGLAIPICSVNLVPMAALEYTHLTLGQFTENGAPGANLTVLGRHYNAAQAAVGIQFLEISEPESFVPELHFWYINTFRNPNLLQVTNFVAGGPEFAVIGPQRAKNAIDIGGSITTTLTDNYVLRVGYDFEMRKRYTCSSAYINIRIEFLGGYSCGC